MDISITQFRRELFDLVNRAMDGADVCVVHRGRRLKLQPLDAPTDRLSRITRLPIAEPVPQPGEGNPEASLLTEMSESWERDWASL